MTHVTDMTADEIIVASYRAQAIIAACSLALQNVDPKDAPETAGTISSALDAANDILAAVHDALELRERKP